MLNDLVDPRLGALVVRAGVGCSTARQRQLHWVAGELTRHWLGAGTTDQPLEVLLEAAALTDFLTLADAGGLRSRISRYDTPEGPRPSSVSSARTRRDCLALLTAAAQLAYRSADRPPPPALHLHLAGPHADRALAALVAAALAPDAHPLAVRAALVAALAHQHGLRTGEIAAVLLTDIDPVAATITWRASSPAAGPGAQHTATLQGNTATVLQRWLALRAELAQPRTRQLLVSVHGNHDGAGLRRPAGLGLQHRGLARAHARAIAALNSRQLGEPGFTPLPGTLGLLRPTDPPLRPGH